MHDLDTLRRLNDEAAERTIRQRARYGRMLAHGVQLRASLFRFGATDKVREARIRALYRLHRRLMALSNALLKGSC